MRLGPRVILGLVLGALGGALGWLVSDFVFNPPNHPEKMLYVTTPFAFAPWGALIGACIGLGLGMADGLAAASPIRLPRLTVRGGLAGCIGGLVGMPLGSMIYAVLGGDPVARNYGFLAFLLQAVYRAIAWTFWGGLMGGLYGGLDAGYKKGRNGAIGGAIGGFLGGFIFNPISYAVHTDRIGRLLGWVILGGLIGFFTALVALLLKTAWVFVVYGRNEGREIILERTITHIGRNELAEVPIFRDRLVAANHAEIHLQNGRYTLIDGGSAVGTSVNGQKVAQPVLLKDSDLVQVGNTQVIFYERATAGPVRRKVDLSQAAPAAPPLVPEGTCPFCGEKRDPVTGACACSTPAGNAGAPSVAAPAPYSPAPFGGGPSPAVTGTLRLTILSGANVGQAIPLSGSELSVGRDAANDVPLVNDTTVSRRHALLVVQGGQCQVIDQGSSNGTFVNGVRVSQQAVAPGDEIVFGTVRCRLEA